MITFALPLHILAQVTVYFTVFNDKLLAAPVHMSLLIKYIENNFKLTVDTYVNNF